MVALKTLNRYAVMYSLRYLKSAPKRALLYRDHGQIKVKGYNDVDWAWSAIDKRFTTGYYCMLVETLSYKSERSNILFLDLVLRHTIYRTTTHEFVCLKQLVQGLCLMYHFLWDLLITIKLSCILVKSCFSVTQSKDES